MLALFLGTLVVKALFLAAESPADNTYYLVPNISRTQNEFICTVQGNETANISAVRLFTNYTGTWESNASNVTSIPILGNLSNVTFGTHNFKPMQANTPDGFKLIWSCQVEYNITGGTAYNLSFTSNRTLFVELPPNRIVLEGNNNMTIIKNVSDTAFLNLTVTSPYLTPTIDDRNVTDCDIYGNDTGRWAFRQRIVGVSNLSNTTPVNFTDRFLENRSVAVGAKCWERGIPQSFNWSANISLNVDYTKPSIAVLASNGSSVLNSNTVNLTFDVTDNDAVVCSLYHNFTGGWVANLTNRSVNSYGVATRVSNFFIGAAQSMDDGANAWSVSCSDYAGNNQSVNLTFNLDTTVPQIFNVTNFSRTGYIDEMRVEWNTTEASNASVLYGNTTSLLNNNRTGSGTTFGLTHSIAIKITPKIVNYFNITSCDAAGNCNASTTKGSTVLSTISNYNVTMWPLYAGWTAYASFERSSSLGLVANRSGAEYAYMFNQSSQSWLAHTTGGSSNAQTVVRYNDAVWLFRSSNFSWFRNATPDLEPQSVGITGFQYNLSPGINFLGVLRNYEMTNLTPTFYNSTGGFFVSINGSGNAPGLGRDNANLNLSANKIDFFAVWSNVDQKYYSHFRNSTFGNRTNLTVGDVFVVGTKMNVTWNSTGITGNWTASRG